MFSIESLYVRKVHGGMRIRLAPARDRPVLQG